MKGKFEFIELPFSSAYMIKPFYSNDERGCFIKDYNVDIFSENGIDCKLKETFYTKSKKGVIRALHFQLGKEQPKLMRCILGRVWYVIVDLRFNSKTFGQYLSMELCGEEPLSIYCPAGFAQGYMVIEDAIMSYKASQVFFPKGDSGIMYDDPDLGIKWPFERIGGKDKLIISERDLRLMSLQEYLHMSDFSL